MHHFDAKKCTFINVDPVFYGGIEIYSANTVPLTIHEARAALRQMQKEAEDPDKDLQGELEDAEREGCAPGRGRGRARGRGKGRSGGKGGRKGRGRGRGKGDKNTADSADSGSPPDDELTEEHVAKESAHDESAEHDKHGSSNEPDVACVDGDANAPSPTSMEVMPSPRKRVHIKRKKSKLGKLRAMSRSPRHAKRMVCTSAEPEPANAEDAGASQAEGQPPETVLELPSGGTEPENKKPRKRNNTSPKKPSKKGGKSKERETEPTKRKKDSKANNDAEPGDEPGEDKGAEQKEKERAIKEPCSL